jgi:hypothetical protein
MRISATQWKSGDWRGAATEPLGDVLHSEGEVLRSSDQETAHKPLPLGMVIV